MATHQFATARRRGGWELIETPELKQAKAEIKKMNDELESRVLQRTQELEAANQQLSQAQAELAHINRVTTTGELAASIAHEVKQPISAASINAHTCLKWVQRDVPDLEQANEAATRVVQAVTRAGDVISKITSFFKKDVLQRELLDVNELVREMIVLLRTEAIRYSVSIRTELAENVPKVLADRVQLQQVFMNLMLNGFDAMNESTRGPSSFEVKSLMKQIRSSAVCHSPRAQNRVRDRLCHVVAETFASDVVGPEMLAGIDSAQARLLRCHPRSWCSGASPPSTTRK